MVDNIVGMGMQIFWISFSAAVLILFATFLALRNHSRRPPGSKGHRDPNNNEPESIKADGYIDSFANEIEEGGGSLTPLVWIVIVLVLAWWGIYILLYWNPR